MSQFVSGFAAVIGRPNVGKSSLINTMAVSYTHLDVYKRQALCAADVLNPARILGRR